MEVVAAIIIHEGRILATQRGYGSMKDYWEFPGGKVEAGETREEALHREIREELATEIRIRRLFETIEHDYEAVAEGPRARAAFHLTLYCYLCEISGGAPQLLEHEAARWLAPDDLLSVDWLPADLDLVERLQKFLREDRDMAQSSMQR
ncbi:MAG: (deoxy)nucleoside triphosphate pyrophosphohydrolase [Bacteroidaceae bacterium]|nr:(deoxy)nucleoside triphosphate pyrophosphohydrolase [Bacteroidaceae bacterium]